MPTENRSSNTEMVSVPRDLVDLTLAHLPSDSAAKWEIHDLLAKPALPHPEPIAWMVGTAIWWTKEEAERDAAATGLPVTPVGPITESSKPAEQHQGDPVAPAFVMPSSEKSYGFGYVDGTCIQSLRGYRDHLEDIVDSIPEGPLYTHADPGEVERLSRKAANADLALGAQTRQVHSMRAQLAKAQEQLRTQDDLLSEAYQRDIGTPLKRKIRANHDALFASAEPNASIWSCQPCRQE